MLAFEPHPQEFFRPRPDSIRLTPLRIKARLLAELGVDALFALPFDAEMAGRSAGGFRRGGAGERAWAPAAWWWVRISNSARAAAAISPPCRQMGAAQGFSVTCFDMVTTDAAAARRFPPPASARRLKAARPEEAASLLGRWWAVEARVEHGDGRGRTMGFPTANMHLGHCLAPAFGVYAVRVTILDNDEAGRSRHDGVANFGIRPMYQTKVPLMEAHLFDFDGDLYGKHLWSS